MANENLTPDSGADASIQPNIRRIGTADLKDALVKGFADFNAIADTLGLPGLNLSHCHARLRPRLCGP
jgi:hypothetical protein